MAEQKPGQAQDHIYNLLMQDDEITWQTIIMDLVKTEQMNPWDVDVSTLSQKYLEKVKQMEELNFFVSGKIILASAILLKLKSNQFMLQDLAEFDNLLYATDEDELAEPEDMDGPNIPDYLRNKEPRLTIKTPQPRKRKVSVNDLVDALKKALEVENRKIQRVLDKNRMPEDLSMPEKKIDINAIIKDLHGKVRTYFEKNKSDLTFNGLVPSGRKEDKLGVFVPLLHLSNQQKIHLTQPVHFDEIYIQLKKLQRGK